MVQSIFEVMGCRYERQGEYILPCLTIPPEKEQPIELDRTAALGLSAGSTPEYHTPIFSTSGRLNAYLANITGTRNALNCYRGHETSTGHNRTVKGRNA